MKNTVAEQIQVVYDKVKINLAQDVNEDRAEQIALIAKMFAVDVFALAKQKAYQAAKEMLLQSGKFNLMDAENLLHSFSQKIN